MRIRVEKRGEDLDDGFAEYARAFSREISRKRNRDVQGSIREISHGAELERI